MERNKKIFRSMTDDTGLPSEFLPGQFLLELLGQERVLIENHQGVQEYGCEKICIRASFGSVSVWGNDLRLSCISKDRLVIVGPVSRIEVTRRDH